jgi:hypothetical protein
MGRNLQLSRPTTPYGLICAPPLIGHRAQTVWRAETHALRGMVGR